MRTAVLFVNLGSPDSPNEDDVRTYLAQFLHDPFVIDYPKFIRNLIVDGIVLKRRPSKTATLYKSIWMDEGAPLIVNTQRLVNAVSERIDHPTAMAMRYGNPSIESTMIDLKHRYPDLTEITLVPLYPHAAMATTHTVTVEVERVRRTLMPDIQVHVVRPWYDNEVVLDILARKISRYMTLSTDAVVLSYHGVPVRHLKKMDPTHGHCKGTETCCRTPSESHEHCYRHQCLIMTDGIAERLDIDRDDVHMTFQSRFGPDKWLDPATDDRVKELAASGKSELVIASPAFVADCLETLEELNIGTRQVFRESGGETFAFVPCLNDDPEWVAALLSIVALYLPSAA
jgi:protoporphyrin/coproporphyrin ferrochelatase